MVDNSAEYYRSREQKERNLAQAAFDPAIAAIHLDMAARYSKLISPTPGSAQADA